ncbi:MAG: RIP metalloprotease RseP [Lachnospiraceae bacterium]
MSIIYFAIILGVLVSVHEFGHFLLAKINGIRVLEFSIGMGPQLVHTKRGETVYSLRLLPIGGACMFDGEDGIVRGDTSPDEHCFQNAGVWSRIITVLAGPVFNFILAFVISVILVNATETDVPLIVEVTEESPAEQAGLLVGDMIVSINGEKVYLYREVQMISQLNEAGDTLELVVDRDGTYYDIAVNPSYSEEDGRYLMGILGGEYIQMTGLEVFEYAFYEVRYAASSVYKSLLLMLKGQVGSEDVAGVVGIANMVEETYEIVQPSGFIYVLYTMMSLTAVLSVNLGIVNLLPIPALDGGRLVFLIVEVFRGKPISPEKEGYVHAVGFIFLMLLMVFLLFNDLKNIFFL